MENIRAFSVVHNLKALCTEILHRPYDLMNELESTKFISQNGVDIYIASHEEEVKITESLEEAIFMESFTIVKTVDYSSDIKDLIQIEVEEEEKQNKTPPPMEKSRSAKKEIITVGLNKLDKLMDLVGEIVITESMVSQNPDLEGLQLENFNKSARLLRKLTDELQDVVMDIRMVPVSGLFKKMRRIVRDMSKNLGKEVELVLVGENTEVDKSILDTLSDPLMHLIRNSMDHGIEEPNERISNGKSSKGVLKLEARNTGSEVLLSITDDGRGIDRDKVWEKAFNKELITTEQSEMTDREIYELILMPGFSTKEQVSEYSGRGVGMDVVKTNIENVRGNIRVDSKLHKGTTVEIKIPLTLAIIDGMEVAVGQSRYTVPTIAIKESFRPGENDVFCDPSGNEMMMIRGNCYPVIRLHDFFKTNSKTPVFHEGIIMVVENEEETVCLFVDALLGQQQVVVKPLPTYVSKYIGDVRGIGGCTIMGNGEMSLILNVNDF